MAYSEKVMDHFQHPRNVGEIENASGVGTVGNAKCGDIMRIFLDIDDETHIIKDCKFKTFGCGAAVATSSMATEMVMGKTIEEAMEVTNKAVMEALDGLPPVKYTAPCLQRKQSMRLCGIMHRSIILRLKVLRNQSLIFTKVKKQRKKNIDYSKKSESVCNLKSLFIKKGRVILIICPVLYIMALYDTRDKRYFVKQFPQFLLYDAAINIFCRR